MPRLSARRRACRDASCSLSGRPCWRSLSTTSAMDSAWLAAAIRAAARTTRDASRLGATHTSTRSRASQRPLTPCSARWRCISASARSAARRRAISRRAIRLPTLKKPSRAWSMRSGTYTLPSLSLWRSASGGMSTTSMASARSTTASGTVSFTTTPVTCATASFRLSRCCTLTAVYTSIPASSSSSTSCHRLGWRDSGAFVWASSSTRTSAGRRARAASRSNSSTSTPRYARRSRGRTSSPSDEGQGFRPPVRLDVAHQHVKPPRALLVGLREHGVRLAHARRSAEEHL